MTGKTCYTIERGYGQPPVDTCSGTCVCVFVCVCVCVCVCVHAYYVLAAIYMHAGMHMVICARG